MKVEHRLGPKVRALRKERGLTQAELARRLDISGSYLNLIEKDQRSLTAPLLLKIAQEFGLDLSAFTSDADDQLVADVLEVLSDPLFEARRGDEPEVRELVAASPDLARAFTRLYHAYRESRQSVESLASQIYDTHQEATVPRAPLASEEVSDFIQRHCNYFPELEAAAQGLWEQGGLQRHDLFNGLVRHLADAHGVEVRVDQVDPRDGALRRYDPTGRVLSLSESMPPTGRVFQAAVQIALIEHRGLLDRLGSDHASSSPTSRTLATLVLANYFAGAVVMPYEPMLEAAVAERYDIELLGHRFGASFEQVCHRLTSLRRPGLEGVPFHMIRVDLAGNISKRFSASGIRFARFAGACPRWNVFSAFLTPGHIRHQVSVMLDGEAYFCVARTVPRSRGGFHTPHTVQAIGLGCPLSHAEKLVYSDGVDVRSLANAVPVGVTCRLCERRDCDQRAFPSMRTRLEIDENVRGPAFYTPPGSTH